LDDLDDIAISEDQQSVLTFFTAMLNQIKFCVDAYEAHDAVEAVSIQIQLTPGFAEEHGLKEESFMFVLDEELLNR
jgi:hypothetical protein